jgi:hypothetical protein
MSEIYDEMSDGSDQSECSCHMANDDVDTTHLIRKVPGNGQFLEIVDSETGRWKKGVVIMTHPDDTVDMIVEDGNVLNNVDLDEVEWRNPTQGGPHVAHEVEDRPMTLQELQAELIALRDRVDMLCECDLTEQDVSRGMQELVAHIEARENEHRVRVWTLRRPYVLPAVAIAGFAVAVGTWFVGRGGSGAQSAAQ